MANITTSKNKKGETVFRFRVFLGISPDGKQKFRAIAPGVKISLNALSQGTALLPSIGFSMPERAIGRNTMECMQSGLMFGTAAMLDGLKVIFEREKKA